MRNLEPTKRQKEILDAVSKYISINGYPPSIRDLGKEVRLKSSSSVSAMLGKLRKKGYVTWQEGKPRTLKIIKVKENVPL